MLICHKCQKKMEMRTGAGIRIWACPTCNSHSMTLAVLTKFATPGMVTPFWETIWDGKGIKIRPCPACSQPMTTAINTVAGKPLEIDGCRSCQVIWFDEGELKRLAPNLNPPEDATTHQCPPVPQRSPNLGDPLPAQETAPEDLQPEGWMWAAGILGLPIEVDTPYVRIRPWITWSLAAAIVCFGVATVNNGVPVMAQKFGLIPANLTRLGGLTFLTSFFVHGGIIHFLSNLYFLVVFGDNVEEELGWARYLLLLVSATLMGGLFHAIGDQSQDPCIGARGGISGVITC